MPFDGTELSEVTKLLIAGKERIEKYGWVQNKCGSKDEGYCLGASVWAFGSIDTAQIPFDYDDILKAREILEYNILYMDICRWNDTHATSKEEVLEVLDKAIAASINVLYMDIRRWNDTRATSKEEVLQVLDEAIAASIKE